MNLSFRAISLPLFFACLLFGSIQLSAQSDTEFWFVVPEVAAEHGDSPIQFGVSSTGDAASVRISLPADPSFSPIEVQLAPNEARIVGVSQFKETLENKPANVILNKGVFIESDVPITAFYHSASRNNQDIYALKGRQALGLEFMIPSQRHFPNISGEAAFDIVATEDQTVLTITPSRAIVGHNAGESFQVTLNRGESFSCRAISDQPAGHLDGSIISANKPVAVTNSDDSIINRLTTGWDLVGDQIVPINLLGNEYIAVRGEGATERVYILATEDNTVVELNGGVPRFNLNKGESAFHEITQRAAYIKSDKPVYVWHLSGFNNEPGGAILPPLGCTGQQEINFSFPFQEDFAMLLLTEKGNEDAFELNGDRNKIRSNSFFNVQGSEDFVAARIDFSLFDLQAGNNRLINGKGLFHLGVIIFTGPGCAYGYFSNYNSLVLGESRNFCEGDSLTLDAGLGKDNYLWSTGSTEPSIQVDSSGIYWVRTQFAGCELSDTVAVEEIILPLELGPDSTLCDQDSITLNVSQLGASYLWDNGETGPIRTINEPGQYFINLSRNGCEENDSINIAYTLSPELSLGPDTLLCLGESISFDVEINEGNYQWQDGSPLPFYSVSEAGTYWVEREFRNCFRRDTVEVGIRQLNFAARVDTLLCDRDTLSINETAEGVSYLWEDGNTSPERTFAQKGIYRVNLSNRCEATQKTWIVDFEDCSCELFVPNVFTPNGDGLHDQFTPSSRCQLAFYNLQIFDRWGRQIFLSAALEDRWEGKWANRPAQEGVYYWVVQYENGDIPNASRQVKKGTVTLLR